MNLTAKNPEISIVIPLFNKGFFISRAISSVLNQTRGKIEIIVVDDGSTDDGGRIVHEICDLRLRLIKQENLGVSNARNRGINEAKSDLIAFLDADDEYKPDFVKTILMLREHYPLAKAFGTGYEIQTANKKTKTYTFDGIPKKPWHGILNNYFISATNYTPFCSSSIAIDKSIFSVVGYFMNGITLGEDLEMWTRIAINSPIAYSNEIQSIYHYDSSNRASESGFVGPAPFAKTIEQAINSGQIRGNQKTDALEFLARHQLEAVFHNLKSGDRETAKRILYSIKYTKKFRFRWLWRWIWCNMPESIFNLFFGLKKRISELIG